MLEVLQQLVVYIYLISLKYKLNYIKLFTLSIFAFLFGCSNVDNDEIKLVVNYIYSKTIVQSILDKMVKENFGLGYHKILQNLNIQL